VEKIYYTIVIPIYYNEFNILPTFKILKDEVITKNKDKKCELVFIDDGSGDKSYQVLCQLKVDNPEILIRIIKFTRNFGQQPAVIAGYEYAQGECVIAIDADLQDPPELINQMLHSFFVEKYPIVIATRAKRKESLYRRFTSKIAYSFIKILSGHKNLPSTGFNFSLIGKHELKVIVENLDINPFFAGEVLSTGYKIKFIPYTRAKREIGRSKWTFRKKFQHFINNITAFSALPLRFMSFLGVVVALLGFVYAILIVIGYFFGNTPINGWAAIMVSIYLIGGMIMIMLGVIGEYLWRVLEQVRKKKRYIIETIQQ